MLWLLLLALTAEARPPTAQAGRTVMVQLFEWPWTAVAEECENYLGPKGFAAVQISPPTEHLRRPNQPWWERYQPVSHKLESRAGTEIELQEMLRRCRAAGVDVYADVVLNHMAGFIDGQGFSGTSFTHYEYPGLFSYDEFHHCGRNGNDDIRDFTSLYELLNCELLNLADLHTGLAPVQAKLATLLQRLLDLGVSGFRIDAAKHMSPEDMRGIFARVRGAFYVVQELIISPGEPVDVRSYLPLGDVNVFPYAYVVGEAFSRGDLGALTQLPGKMGVPSEAAVVFLENHDLERRPAEEPLLSFVKDRALYELGLAFVLTWPYGYPQLYSGYTFHDFDAGPPTGKDRYTLSPLTKGQCRAPWTCAHRAPGVAELVDFRNRTSAEFRATDVWQEGGFLAFGRGALGHVVINASRNARTLEVTTRLPSGTYANRYRVGAVQAQVAKGKLTLTLPPRTAFVTLAEDRL